MKVTFEKVDESIHTPEYYKFAQTETLAQHIEKLTYRLDIAHLIIHDIISCDRYFCDQGCKNGEGCKKDYTPDNHSLMMSATVIKVPEDFGKIIEDTEATEYQLEMIKRLRIKFPDLDINVGRGDRLMVDNNVIKGFLLDDVRNRKDYNTDEEVFSNEIKEQIVDRHLWANQQLR